MPSEILIFVGSALFGLKWRVDIRLPPRWRFLGDFGGFTGVKWRFLDKKWHILTVLFVSHKLYTVRHPFWQFCLSTQSINATETTWSCNMSYERKFCGLSEYVRLQNVRPLIKSIDRSKWDSVDFGKWPNSQIMVNLRSLSTLCKLLWSMTINMRPI